MAAELIRVWSRTWREVWAPLDRGNDAPEDLFIELTRALVEPPAAPVPPRAPPFDAYDNEGQLVAPQALKEAKSYEAALAKFSDERDSYESALSGVETKSYFRRKISRVSTETGAVRSLELAWECLEDLDHPNLKERYRQLVQKFIRRYNIRYDLREPFALSATLPGLFSQLAAAVRDRSSQDQHLKELFEDFEESLSDLRYALTATRMKTCLQKQFVLIEALGARHPGVTAQTFGAMCDQLDWPHATIKDVGKKLYGFRSNYPGLGHAGNPQSVLRQIDMKDFLSLSLMLTSFAPYVLHELDAERCYAGE